MRDRRFSDHIVSSTRRPVGSMSAMSVQFEHGVTTMDCSVAFTETVNAWGLKVTVHWVWLRVAYGAPAAMVIMFLSPASVLTTAAQPRTEGSPAVIFVSVYQVTDG